MVAFDMSRRRGNHFSAHQSLRPANSNCLFGSHRAIQGVATYARGVLLIFFFSEAFFLISWGAFLLHPMISHHNIHSPYAFIASALASLPLSSYALPSLIAWRIRRPPFRGGG